MEPHEKDHPAKKTALVRVYPRYVRVRQGGEVSYHIKLSKPPTKVRQTYCYVCTLCLFSYPTHRFFSFFYDRARA